VDIGIVKMSALVTDNESSLDAVARKTAALVFSFTN